MDDPEIKDSKQGESTPSSPLRNITMNLVEEQRFRSDSEPIMQSSRSTISLNSSLASDRDSVISTSSTTSSEANMYMHNPHHPNSTSFEGTVYAHKSLIIQRTSSTRSAPSDTLMRGSQLTGSADSDGYYEGDADDQDQQYGDQLEDRGQEEERDEDEDNERDDAFPDDVVTLRSPQQSGIIRKSAIRRTHTVTPAASPRIKARRAHRSSSKGFEKVTSFAQEAGTENFSITVDLPSCKELVLYPARKGVTLRDALKEISESKNFKLTNINVFVESSLSPTPLETECFLFANRQLFVRDKNHPIFGDTRKDLHLSRFASKPIHPGLNNDRSRSISCTVVPSIHVDNGHLPRPGGRVKKDLSKFLGVETDQKGRTRRPSLPGTIAGGTPQAAKKMDPKLEALQNKLDYYTLEGLPDFPSLILGSPQRDDDDEELLKLEENWRLVVDNHSELPKRVIDQQEAIWEIIHTEVGYIKNIRVIIDIYMTCLIDLQAAGLLNSIQAEKIFSNITDIEIRHSKFWKEKLINVMRVARETKEPLSAGEVGKAFEGFGDHFKPYIKFVTEEGSCMEFLREKRKEDEQLQMFLRWCQDYKDSRRLNLDDLLVYPMQRITKYPLLLRAIGKKTDHESDKLAINTELANVQTFCNRINHEVRSEEETKKMKKMTERIELYDWPEIPPGGVGKDEVEKLIDQTPEKIDLHYPMQGAFANQQRWVVHEGTVKIRDQYTTNRFDCTIVIFTDMITICKRGKTKENSLRIVRPPIKVDTVKTNELKDNSGFVMLCFDEFGCASNWYIVSTQTTSKWLQRINKAREMYESAQAHKNMDKFLDTSQSAYLQLPEFLKQKSPRTSPMSSPRLPQKMPLEELFQQPKENGDKDEDAEKKNVEEVDDLCDKESESSSMEESQDADEEESDSAEEQTPVLARPNMFPNDRRESIKNSNENDQNDNGCSESKHNTLTTPVDSIDFMNLSCEASPTSPTAQTLSIMAFDDDFDSDENPSNPTLYVPVIDNSATKTERTKAKTTFKDLGGTISKAFLKGKERSRKPVPNNVLKAQMADQGPSSSDESCGDILEKDKKKKDKKSMFSKSKGKNKSK